MSFENIVNTALAQCLLKRGINTPTGVQTEVIPHITEGRDIIASSPTGTGKTLAYLLPVFMKIDISIKAPQALILTPTHELAVQVFKEAERISKDCGNGIQPALIIGGASINRQLLSLKEKPRIIVGSAGRILELISMKKLTAHYIKTIVLDEGDRLLDDKNVESVTRVINCTLRDRQLLFFSATANSAAVKSAESIMKEPVKILLTQSGLPKNIEHIYFICEKRDKLEILRKLVHAEKIIRTLAFVNKENELEILVKRLNYHGISAAGLYGGANKNDRRLALEAFRTGRAAVLAASDLASRGLDIEGLTHVINMDCPEDPGIYLHRAGRCGRMNEKGVAASIVTEHEAPQLLRNAKKLGIQPERKKIEHGKLKAFL